MVAAALLQSSLRLCLSRAPMLWSRCAVLAAERYEQDSIDIGTSAGKEEGESALNQAQASLLDMGEGADGSGTPLSATAAGAASSSGGALADLMSFGGGGGGGSGVAAAQAPPQSAVDLLGELIGSSRSQGPAAPPAAAPAAGLSGLDDLLGGLHGSSLPAAPQPSSSCSVSLLPQPQISAADFQQKWAAWTADARSFQQPLSSAAVSSVESNAYRVSACGHLWEGKCAIRQRRCCPNCVRTCCWLPSTAVSLFGCSRLLQDFTAHIGQAHVANFATPREGGAPPYRFLFHAQAAGSGAHVLVQVRCGACVVQLAGL